MLIFDESRYQLLMGNPDCQQVLRVYSDSFNGYYI
ncbi:MAG: hypothetical protein ACI9Y7_001653 [Dokdonia sp.]|jgi:hypothetical protein